jgi:uncharacterized protein YbaA (DUF1428 family)
MAYIDGFVIAVPSAKKQQFIAYANKSASVFIDHGATRVIECWGADVPKGKTTDFQGAVAAKDDETVVFAWIEWPDKARRDGVMGRMDELGKTDERFDPAKNSVPFDITDDLPGFEPSTRWREGRRRLCPLLVKPVPAVKRRTTARWPKRRGDVQRLWRTAPAGSMGRRCAR